MDSGEKGHLFIFKDGCGWPETNPTAGGTVEPGSDRAALVNDSSQRLVALWGMTSVVSLSSLGCNDVTSLWRVFDDHFIPCEIDGGNSYDCGLKIQHKSGVSTDICHACL